jgi:hypothetical protein
MIGRLVVVVEEEEVEDFSCMTTEPARLKLRRNFPLVRVRPTSYLQTCDTPISGVKMLVSNLGPEVTDEDIQV